MVTRFARIGGVVIAMVVLLTQRPVATRVDQIAGADNAADVTAAAVDVTVHEWGTFTTVAGEDGRAVEWLPLGGSTDLPCFVYSFNRLLKVGIPAGPIPDYTTARRTLKGTVRMETPVLYFYAPKPAVVDVSVQFRRGLFSEWYPDAAVTLPANFTNLARANDTTGPSSGWIFWNDVNILPNATGVAAASFPGDKNPSHYYAARETDAAPVQVKGELEKFLFYRGVAGFESPIRATLAAGGTVTVTNNSEAEIPHVMLFTRHGSKLGYRIHTRLAANEQVTLDRPAADLPLDAVTHELEQTLVAQGLYGKEAKAMIETWRDSWFEDGTRVFYIVPSATVDLVLPLNVMPAPKAIVRVFVGRAEVIDGNDIGIVKTALTNRDHSVLARYGRLLGPIADRAIAKTNSPAERAGMTAQLDTMLRTHASRLLSCGAQPSAPADTASAALSQAFTTPW